MYPHHRIRQYQREAVIGLPPEKLVAKLYDVVVAACHAGDRSRVRAALVQLVNSLDFERGGELAQRLHAIYVYGLTESALGDLAAVGDVMAGLRDAWQQGVVRPAAA